jgi:hypothetical protein
MVIASEDDGEDWEEGEEGGLEYHLGWEVCWEGVEVLVYDSFDVPVYLGFFGV